MTRVPQASMPLPRGVCGEGDCAEGGLRQGFPGKGNNILFTVAFAECYRPFEMPVLWVFPWPVRKDGFIFLE